MGRILNKRSNERGIRMSKIISSFHSFTKAGYLEQFNSKYQVRIYYDTGIFCSKGVEIKEFIKLNEAIKYIEQYFTTEYKFIKDHLLHDVEKHEEDLIKEAMKEALE